MLLGTMLVAATVLGAQSDLPQQAAQKARRFVRLYDVIRTADAQVNVVENLVYTVFFSEAGHCPRPAARRPVT